MAESSQQPSSPQPPYLKHVHLRNVPPLRDVTADFKPGLNVIIGKNGSGKTQFLKLVSDLTNLFQEKYHGAESEFSIVKKDTVIVSFQKRENKLQSPDKKIDFRYLQERPLSLTVTNGVNKAKSERLFDALLDLEFDTFSVVDIWHGLPNYRLPIVDEGLDFIFLNSGFLNLVSDSEAQAETKSRLVTAIIKTIEMHDTSISLNEKDLIGQDEKVSLFRNAVLQSVNMHLGRLNRYLPSYSPLQAVRCSEQFQVYFIASTEELIVKGLVLEYLIGGEWLPFRVLSDGTKRIFYIMGEVLTPLLSYLDEDGKETQSVADDKIILLEEPELGIHPDQLHLLLQLIREVSREHQVILTTHSPQTLDILNKDELDRISICEYVPGKGTQMRKLSAAKQAKARAYLRDEGFLSEFWRFSNLEDPD